MIITLVAVAVVAAIVFYFVGSATAKAAVKTELTSIEADAVTDAKTVVARIKTIL
jgi:hypothetical protein